MALDVESYLLGKSRGGGSGGTSDYSDLTNKPSINGVTLSGNKTSGDLGIAEGIPVLDIANNEENKTKISEFINKNKDTYVSVIAQYGDDTSRAHPILTANIKSYENASNVSYIFNNKGCLSSYQSYSTYYFSVIGDWVNGVFTCNNISVSNGEDYTALAVKNTRSYTPTSDYNPATKKYVDDAVAGAGGSSCVIITRDNMSDSSIITSLNAEYQKYKNGQPYKVMLKDVMGTAANAYFLVDMYFYGYSAITPALYSPIMNSSTSSTEGVYRFEKSITLVFDNSSYDNVTSITSINTSQPLIKGLGAPLGTNNINTYTPSSPYNPATKFYVDKLIDESNGLQAYNNGTSYVVGDKVYWVSGAGVYGHYRCIQDCKGKNPYNTSYWETFNLTSDQSTLSNKAYVDGLLSSYTGYDATKTQTLKNVNGTFTWVDD